MNLGNILQSAGFLNASLRFFIRLYRFAFAISAVQLHYQQFPPRFLNINHQFVIEIAIWDSTCLFETTPDAPIPCNRVRSHIYPGPERSKR